ncbi:hypothetical protein PENSPDRAFT_593649, partial [Peniophora sp. CONT]
MNVIFAGDFAQLPPVSSTRLYADIHTASSAQGGTAKGQKVVLGKLLWLSVNTAVTLVQPMRQSGPENAPFVELLSRLRFGRYVDMADPSWQSAPMIVSDNAIKDALNEQAAAAFARRTGREMHWYYSSD